MCKACQQPPIGRFALGFGLKDIKRACQEGQKLGPTRWQAPPRSTKAELTYQLRRLEANRQHEMEEMEALEVA